MFVDRSLGTGSVVDALRSVDAAVIGELKIHDDMFPQDTDDEVWLVSCGDNRWVGITKDKLRESPTEREAIKSAKAAVFRISAAKLSGPALGELIVKAMPLIRKALRRFHPPLLVTLTASGGANVMIGNGEDFKPYKALKP